MFRFNLLPLFCLAVFGLACAALLLIGGAGWLIALLIEHVRLV